MEENIMGVGDALLLGITILMLVVAGYLVYNEVNIQDVQYKEFISNVTFNSLRESNQFYPNMRFPSKDLGYSIDEGCSIDNKEKIIQGIDEISEKTIVTFSPSNNPDIHFECSSNPPTSEQRKNHIVAGAARPRFINATRFYVLQDVNISLYVEETCQRPIVVIHETLHALGFDHVNDKDNIMYPVSDCDQEIDEKTVDEINRLYSVPDEVDLVIEKVSGNTTRRYLTFDITVSNLGVIDAEDVTLTVINEDNLVEDFDLEEIKVGQTKTLSVSNLRISSNSEVKFLVKNSKEIDLNPGDNSAELFYIPISE